MEIREVTAAAARSMRTGAPERHIDDEREGALHLGVLEDGALIGAISGLPAGPEGQTDGSWLLVVGPFGAHGEALVERLAARLAAERPLGWLWAPEPTTGLTASGNRWQRPATAYDASSIQVLDSVEAIRKRPGMYVGSTEARGVESLLWELVSNTLDEHLAGHARQLWVQLGPVGLTVADDGRGIPVDCAPDLLERLCTVIAASSQRGEPRQHVHVGPLGLGLVVVNALSSVMTVTVDRERRYQQTFAQGRPLGPLLDVGPAPGRGTAVWFVPDTAIFGGARLDTDRVSERLGELAVLDPGLAFHLDGRPLPSLGGLPGLARSLAEAPIAREWHTRGRSEGISVEIAVCWGSGRSETRGWANRLPCAGSHVDGLLAGLAGAGSEGRVALVSVELDPVVYAGRARDRLDMPDVEAVVQSIAAAGARSSRAG